MSAKIKRSLIILVVVLVLLVAAAAAVVLLPKLGKDGGEITGTTAPLVTITDPVKIAFGGKEVTEYVLEGETWCYAKDTSWPIKQNGVTRILEQLSALVPSRKIEAADSLSAYGLDPADYTLILTDAEGSTETLLFGSAVGDTGCYAMLEGNNDIYIIPTDSNIVSFVASTLYSMVDAELPPSMGEVAIVEMTVSYEGKSASFKQDEEDGWYYLDENGNYIKEEDYSAVGSDGESHTVRKYLNDVGEVVPDFKSQGVRGYNCTGEELSEMGFDSPLVVNVNKTDGTNMVYYVGGTLTDSNGSEFNYFMVEGNPAVFCMASETVAPFMELINVLGK